MYYNDISTLLLSNWNIHFKLGFIRYISIFPITIGLCILGWIIWDFASKDKSSPAMYIDESNYLIFDGLYRIIRNPMYIGVSLILLSEAILFQSITLLIYLISLITLLHFQVIYHEELHLIKKFGKQYEKYDKSTWSSKY